MSSLLHRETIPERKQILLSLEEEYCRRDLFDAVKYYEKLLEKHGVLKRKRIALILPYAFPYLSLMTAIRQLGGTVLGISTQYRQEDLTLILKQLNPHILFISSGSGLDELIVDWAENSKQDTWLYQTSNGHEWERTHFEGPLRHLEEKEAEYISCSSGSTGIPKGFAVTFKALDFSANYICQGVKLSAEDRCLLLTTPTTVFGYACMFAGLSSGASMFIPEKLDMLKIIQTLQNHKINKILTTPSIFRTLYSFLIKINPCLLQSIELVGLTGEAVTPEFLAQFERLSHSTFVGLYGISETGGLMIGDLRTMTWDVFSGVSYKISTCDHSQLDGAIEGELLVKTPGLFTHYYQRSDLTAEAFTDDLWFRTGDLVRERVDGKLELIGRQKAMIKKGGRQVIPQEVEQILLSHPRIEECVVLGFNHDKYGEQIAAFVTTNGNVEETELYPYCSDRLAHYKVPDKIMIVTTIPLAQGKADKMKLKSMFLDS